jgi:uncharacterized coiled-coil protein SlyX
MKKFIIIFLINLNFCLGGAAFAQSQFAPLITKMEKSVLGVEYTNQNDEQRLSRLETKIYGQSGSGSIAQRINKLSQDVNGDLMGQEIAPKRDTFETEEDSIKEDIPKADKNINYPSVNALEDKVFGKEFKGMDVNLRLSNLEKKVFGQENSNSPLNERVEKLQSSVGVENRIASDDNNDDPYTNMDHNGGNNYDNSDNSDPIYFSGNENTPTGMAAPPSDYQTMNDSNSMDDANQNFAQNNDSVPNVRLASIEKYVLKQTFKSDNLSDRLARLETNMFGTVFASDDTQTRLNRISSAYKAEKSSRKYDSNKLTQHVGTAMQIGALLLMVLAFIL